MQEGNEIRDGEERIWGKGSSLRKDKSGRTSWYRKGKGQKCDPPVVWAQVHTGK